MLLLRLTWAGSWLHVATQIRHLGAHEITGEDFSLAGFYVATDDSTTGTTMSYLWYMFACCSLQSFRFLIAPPLYKIVRLAGMILLGPLLLLIAATIFGIWCLRFGISQIWASYYTVSLRGEFHDLLLGSESRLCRACIIFYMFILIREHMYMRQHSRKYPQQTPQRPFLLYYSPHTMLWGL